MKNILKTTKNLTLATLLASSLATSNLYADSSYIAYQGVAYNSGVAVASSNIALRFTIYEENNTTVVYQETASNVATTAEGFFSHQIGSGTRTDGAASYSAITWADNYTLKTEVDYNNGTSYTNLGTKELTSTPYALKAATATKLATPITIGGVSFDGSANVNLPGVNSAGTQSTSGNAATATKLATARTITLSGAVTGSASFDGSSAPTITTTATSDPTLTLSGDVTGSATFTNLGNATLTATVANDSHTHSTYLPLAGGALTGNLTMNNSKLAVGTDTFSTNSWEKIVAYQSTAGLGSSLFLRTVDSGGTGSTNGAQISLNNGATPSLEIFNRETGGIKLSTSNGSKMFIDDSGNVGIGNTAPSEKLHVSGNVLGMRIYGDYIHSKYTNFLADGFGLRWVSDVSSGSGLLANMFRATDNTFWVSNSSTNIYTGVYLANGGTTWISNSDRRIKTNIRPLDNALDKVLSLNPVVFDKYVAQPADENNDGIVVTDEIASKDEAGFIAQEVYESLGDKSVVNVPEDESKAIWGLSKEMMIPYLVASIKEQQEIIESQQASIKALQQETETLKSQIKTIMQTLEKSTTQTK